MASFCLTLLFVMPLAGLRGSPHVTEGTREVAKPVARVIFDPSFLSKLGFSRSANLDSL
jgi:hypothetical protein